MKRFIFVLAVAVLMAVMLVAMAAPAFARENPNIPTKAQTNYCLNGWAHGAQGGPPGVACGI